MLITGWFQQRIQARYTWQNCLFHNQTKINKHKLNEMLVTWLFLLPNHIVADFLFCLQVPLIVPILVLLVSIYLVIAPIIWDPRIEFLYAFLFSISGIIFYVPFVVYKKEIKFMSKYCLDFNLVWMNLRMNSNAWQKLPSFNLYVKHALY